MEYFSDIYYSFPSYDEKKSFINWMNYYVNDINSYKELTLPERKILSQLDLKKLTLIPARQ